MSTDKELEILDDGSYRVGDKVISKDEVGKLYEKETDLTRSKNFKKDSVRDRFP